MTGKKNGSAVKIVIDQPMVPMKAYDRVLRQLIEAKDELRRARQAKSSIEETLAEERAIHAVDRELWRRGFVNSDIPRTASDSGCLHTGGGEG